MFPIGKRQTLLISILDFSSLLRSEREKRDQMRVMFAQGNRRRKGAAQGLEEGRNKRSALYYLESRVLSPFVHCPSKNHCWLFVKRKINFDDLQVSISTADNRPTKLTDRSIRQSQP